MSGEELNKLAELLDKYNKYLFKDCGYDCCNCNMGILEGYSSSFSCALDVVEEFVCDERKSRGLI